MVWTIFDTHLLGVRLNFDVDVKRAAVNVKKKHDAVINVKTPKTSCTSACVLAWVGLIYEALSFDDENLHVWNRVLTTQRCRKIELFSHW